MSRQTHTAFPSVNQHSPPAITQPRDLHTLINQAATAQDVQHVLLPALKRIAQGEGLKGRSKKESAVLGDRLLCLDQWDLSTLPQSGITQMTAGLVYVM
jgi:hypothetical protein